LDENKDLDRDKYSHMLSICYMDIKFSMKAASFSFIAIEDYVELEDISSG